jgi:hypothetical protein
MDRFAAQAVAYNARRLLAAVAAAAFAGLLLGPPAMLAWTERLADSPMASRLNGLASAWNNEASRAGLDTPYRLVRGVERWAETFRFAPVPDQ